MRPVGVAGIWLETRRAFGGEIAEQQAEAEQQHQPGRAEFDAAHDERAAAFAAGAELTGQALGGYGDHGDGRDRDRGAEPHHEGRGDAGPEQALRQRKHQHQDRARAGPHADGEDRAQAAPPAAGAGELVRRRPMRMAAMLVVNVAVVVRMVMVVMVIMVA